MNFRDSVFDLLFPPRCPFCQQILEHPGVCPDCEKALPRREGLPLRELGNGLRCAAPLWYEEKARQGMLRLKFASSRPAAVPLGRLLGECAAESFPGGFDVVTWVPVSKKRKRSRGFDQAELLARSACKLWDTKPVRLLQKTVDNPPQSGIRDVSARRANVLGVYETINRDRLEGHRVLLVDDICTTGSTLGECARVLRDGGAETVVCAAVALGRENRGKQSACGGNIQENRTKSP